MNMQQIVTFVKKSIKKSSLKVKVVRDTAHTICNLKFIYPMKLL